MTSTEPGAAICQRCSGCWNASLLPLCPACLAERWSAREDFITPKHHPDGLRSATDSYRSVVTQRFVDAKDRFIAYAARHGRWYFDTHYQHYVHFTPEPLGQVPGVGVPAGSTMPEHALDSMMIADANRDAHVFAVKREIAEAQIRVGEFVELEPCVQPGCDKLRLPELDVCAVHAGIAAT
jgi:hypothetical protein